MKIYVVSTTRRYERIDVPRVTDRFADESTVPGETYEVFVEIRALVESEEDYREWEAHLGRTLEVPAWGGTVIQCPVCDWELDPATDASGVLGLLGAGVVTAEVEAEVFAHLSQHSIIEWVQACSEADAVIDTLLDRVDGLESDLEQATAMLSRPVPAYAPQGPPSPHAPPFQPAELPAGVGFWPDGRMRVDPEKTLISLIPPGQRPEGMVGRKT